MSDDSASQKQMALNILIELANKNNMNVRLYPNPEKNLEIVPGSELPKSRPEIFRSGYKIRYTGLIQIGCEYLLRFENDTLTLKGILAHELAHIKKKHSLSVLIFGLFLVLLFVITILSWFCSQFLKSGYMIPAILTFLFSILTIIFILVSRCQEYNADAFAAECKSVGKETMINMLEKVEPLIKRDYIGKLTHPSFEKRILRLQQKKI